MENLIRRMSLSIGYLISILFVFELIGEFSPYVEGVFHTLGIKWRYPLMLALFSFGLVYFLDGKLSKPLKYGFIFLLSGVGAFVVIYVIAFFSMTMH